MAQHADLSASGSDLWLNCFASAYMAKFWPDEENDPAREGSFAHAVSAARLCRALNLPCDVTELELMASDAAKTFWTEEMNEHVHGYVQRCLELVPEDRSRVVVYVEQRLNFSAWVPHGFGTGDFWLYNLDTKVMHVRDLKYGIGVNVSNRRVEIGEPEEGAEEEDDDDEEHVIGNSQCGLYALAGYETFRSLHDIEKVEVVIDQPRRGGVKSAVYTIAELLRWGETFVKPRAQAAYRMVELYRNDPLNIGPAPEMFTPGPHCQKGFCPARHTCQARATAAQATFARRPAPGTELDDDQIVSLYQALPEAVKWANGFRGAVKAGVINNTRPIVGMKVVEGSRRVRKIVDETAVVSALVVEGFAKDTLYHHKLRALTDLEKLAGKALFGRIVPEGAIERGRGSPTLVPVSDPRPVWTGVREAEDDFDNEV